MSRITRVLWIGFAALGFNPVLADTFDEYLLAEEFALPAGGGPFDFLDDGRIIVVAGADVYIEDAIRSRTFTFLGALENANIPAFGAAFVRVSPDGDKIAIGNNGFGKGSEVGIFEPQAKGGVISVSWYEVQHFQAAWRDNDTLLLSVGLPTTAVTALDLSDPEAPTITVIITNIGGASAGVALDAEGNLYTGNGFAFAGPSETGWVKAFAHADWTAALAGGAALDFEAGGTLVVDLLSASPLGFDAEGNLYVGGGDFGSGDLDHAGIVRASAVAAALAGGEPADPDDPLQVRSFDPDAGFDGNFYDVNFNATTCELIIREGDLAYVHRGTNPFAARAVQYVQGDGVGNDFISGKPFTDPAAALGPPTVDTTGDGFQMPVDEAVPLVAVNSAFRSFELVGIGIGGHLTLKFNHPIEDHACNPYDIDFIVYGNSFQVGGPPWTNGDPSDAVVGGTIFAEPSLVSVSQDGIEWLTFEDGPFADDFAPTLGRVFDPENPDPSLGDWNEWWGLPTDPTKPLDPEITPADLSGLTVAEAALLYDGAAGGTGFDLSELGLDWIQYVRIEEVGMGIPEIDAVADVAASSGAGALGADLDGDGTVGVPDLILLLGSWGVCPCCPADLDGNGVVRVPDLIILLGSWG